MIRGLKHKFLTLLSRSPQLDRFLRFRNPRKYWQKRGGQTYFEEQEAAYDRTLRSDFIAEEVSRLNCHSLLEIGCGYGKQLKNIASRKEMLLTGVDYSHSQLLKAKSYCGKIGVHLGESDAMRLPFADKCFDAVLSSAVILHNEYPKAQEIIAEIIRVSERYLIHNEDTNITFSRFGYDLAKTYKKMGLEVIKCCLIPSAPLPQETQFTIACLPNPTYLVKAKDVFLQYYHAKD